MRHLKVVLGDLSYINEIMSTSLYVPLNIGYLASFIRGRFGRDVDIVLFKDPDKLLDYIAHDPPDLVGLSLYDWTTRLNGVVIKSIRKRLGSSVKIVMGGPSVDTEHLEIIRLFNLYPEVDGLIPLEGELGFYQLVAWMLSGLDETTPRTPLDGVFWRMPGENVYQTGKQIGLNIDLATLESPYLNGILNPFLDGKWRPIIQMSRMCPYQCAFCVAGRYSGKIRAFPLDKIREELEFICRKFKDYPNFAMLLAENNFGVRPDDVIISEWIKDFSETIGYPSTVHFYTNKQFTERTKTILHNLGKLSTMGLTIALQSESKEALNAIKRKNMSNENVDKAILWAAENKMPVTTELIFGLPKETLSGFMGILDRSVARGFDSILIHNMQVLNGVKMNHQSYRQEHQLQTRFRATFGNNGYINGDFSCECEEVIVSTDTFSLDDFFVVRGLNFMVYVIFSMGFYKWFFHYVRHFNISLFELLRKFIHNGAAEFLPDELQENYHTFCQEFRVATEGELYATPEALSRALQEKFDRTGAVVNSPKLNLLFGARLIYLEKWTPILFKNLFFSMVPASERGVHEPIVDELLNLCHQERIDIFNRDWKTVEFCPSWDLIRWREEKFRHPLSSYPLTSGGMNLVPQERFIRKFEVLLEEASCGNDPLDFAYFVINNINPRSDFVCQLQYGNQI